MQACPYGCRYLHPEKHTVDKCTLCYHRITKGLTTACCENCPTGARQLVDFKNPKDPVHEFLRNNKVRGAEALHGHGSEGLLQGSGWRGAVGATLVVAPGRHKACPRTMARCDKGVKQ